MLPDLSHPLQSTEHLPRISKESGVNIIVGTSYYVDAFAPAGAKLLSVQEVSTYRAVMYDICLSDPELQGVRVYCAILQSIH